MYLCIYNIVTGAQSHSGLCPRERLTGVGRARRNSIQPPASPGSPGGSGDGDVALVCLPPAGAAAVQALISRNGWALLLVQGPACKRCAQAQNLQTHLAELQEVMERGEEHRGGWEGVGELSPNADRSYTGPNFPAGTPRREGRGPVMRRVKAFNSKRLCPNPEVALKSHFTTLQAKKTLHIRGGAGAG